MKDKQEDKLIERKKGKKMQLVLHAEVMMPKKQNVKKERQGKEMQPVC